MIDYAALIIAKAPVPGRVKTRLQPQFSAEQASQLAEAALRDTLQAVSGASWLGVAIDLCGLSEVPEWITGEVFLQSSGNLGDRLDFALAEARSRTSLPIVLLGMDTPQVSNSDITMTLAQLTDADFSLGHARDGGFWTLAAEGSVPRVLHGVPMSEPDTGLRTQQALAEHGTVGLAPVLEDIDDPDSAARVSSKYPATAFARLHREFVMK
jgi:glycosyltransferase A (GT-A) superfamily protein (DUF2064 family)